MTHKRFGFLSRTLLLAALCVAAAGMLGGLRTARADNPAAPSAAAQQAAWLLVGQTTGNPASGATFMQILWGGTKGKDEEPSIEESTVQHRQTGAKAKRRNIPTSINEGKYR